MSDLFDLSGKTVLITGASSGIGREIAIMASMQGAELVLTGRNKKKLAETQDMLPGKSILLIADLTVENGINDLIAGMPLLDGVVFSAGKIEYTLIKFVNYAKIENVFGLNFTSQVMLTRDLVKNKMLKKGASLVYISSISSKLGVAATALYASSKAAISTYMRVVAGELANQKIRANCICPGLVKTPMITDVTSNVSEESFAEAYKDYPLGIGEPADIAGAVVFLLSGASKWMTGSEMIVDGGLTLK